MRWRTANNRRRQQLHGPQLRQAVIGRVALCNRFAVSDAGRLVEVRFDDLVRALCVEKITGKKQITRNVPPEPEARAALAWLMRRYGRLLDELEQPKPRPSVKTGNSEDDWWREQYQRDKAEREAQEVECRWCLKVKSRIEMARVDNLDICVACCGKIAPSVLANDIPL